MARLRRADARLATMVNDADASGADGNSAVDASNNANSVDVSTAAAAVASSSSAVSDVEYACESVLRKRKRKMSKHKMQKRRWKERMNRREFGR